MQRAAQQRSKAQWKIVVQRRKQHENKRLGITAEAWDANIMTPDAKMSAEWRLQCHG